MDIQSMGSTSNFHSGAAWSLHTFIHEHDCETQVSMTYPLPTSRSSQFLSGLAALALLVLAPLQGAVRADVATVSGDTLVVPGDTVRIKISFTGGADITGTRIYLTIDSAVFRPVLYGDNFTEPFIDGPIMSGDKGAAITNAMGDIITDAAGNTLPGIFDDMQLDYIWISNAGIPRPTVTANGIAAFVDLVVQATAPSGALSRIKLDHNIKSR
ncbi:MAG: hypothetical protein IID15_08925, partial [Candidatus Marinimicrobia bacterium]|nr:hypothetical protein [Candidatus Neomarinimicrobiota bacterium]